MARDNIILPHKILKSMRNLSDAECGRLFRALLQYSMGESQSINLQGREIGLFDVYTQDIDDDIAAYERKCKTNRANGTQSGPVAPSRPSITKTITISITITITITKTKTTKERVVNALRASPRPPSRMFPHMLRRRDGRTRNSTLNGL